jgi:hypothetical protein
MWILIAGPYTSGAHTAAARAANLRRMNEAAYAVLELGHVPVIGVNMALPIIETAGAETFDAIMMPVSLALAERCDAVLRIGGDSAGADAEVARVRARGGRVFTALAEIEPNAGAG